MSNESADRLVIDEKKSEKTVLSNQVISNPAFPKQDVLLEWQFTLLKYNEYDNRLHQPLQKVEKQHFHSFFEIHMPIEGMLEYCLEDVSVRVKAGEFLLIFPQVIHQAKEFSPVVKKYSFAFQISAHSPQMDLFEVLCNRNYYVGKQFSQMLEPLQYVLRYVHPSEGNDLYSSYLLRAQYDSFFLAFLENIAQTVRRADGELQKKENIEINDQMIYEHVVTYLQKHISERVMISDVAHELLMSERQLNRRLVRFKGIPFSKIQEQIKCQRARELLASNLSLSEISEMIGMGNEYTFNRFFKRVEGMPPARFRNALRSSNYK